jgi:hypothetical protein
MGCIKLNADIMVENEMTYIDHRSKSDAKGERYYKKCTSETDDKD